MFGRRLLMKWQDLMRGSLLTYRSFEDALEIASFGRLRQRQLGRSHQGADIETKRDPDGGKGDQVRSFQRLAEPDRDDELQRRRNELEHPERRIR